MRKLTGAAGLSAGRLSSAVIDNTARDVVQRALPRNAAVTLRATQGRSPAHRARDLLLSL